MAAEFRRRPRALAALMRGARHRDRADPGVLTEGRTPAAQVHLDNQPLWTAYFQRRHAEQLASTNSAPARRGHHNFEGCRQRWGVPGCMLHAVLEHLEGGNMPLLEYPVPSFSSRSGSSWLPRRIAESSSSSSGSRSSGAAMLPDAIKPEPREMLLRWRSRGGNLVINEGRHQPSPPRAHHRLVKTKKEPTTTVAVKQEHEAMVVELDASLKWSRNDYMREEVERERRAL
ncbi:Homeobox protein KNOX3 [Hordeum vulgare]|uniref:Uncharacterized protein n=1 Tax=Hordeum vulgare subsp. vulgare TaxID=112509 RepID=A0A8I6WHS1_HORVV|nr:Homeobox protein KNOX3 [Hordeum vulgare]